MKYDEKYKMKGVSEAEVKPSLVFSAKHSGSCWHCGDPTNWWDIDFQAPVCSTECHEAKITEYVTDTCRGSVWHALDELYTYLNYPPIEMFSLWMREWVKAQLEPKSEPVEL